MPTIEAHIGLRNSECQLYQTSIPLSQDYPNSRQEQSKYFKQRDSPVQNPSGPVLQKQSSVLQPTPAPTLAMHCPEHNRHPEKLN